jgi:hypothetical protein
VSKTETPHEDFRLATDDEMAEALGGVLGEINVEPDEPDEPVVNHIREEVD